MPKTFDPKCRDLAKAFLSDYEVDDPERAEIELAFAIQETIEDTLMILENNDDIREKEK